jgi:hypothetical protein
MSFFRSAGPDKVAAAEATVRDLDARVSDFSSQKSATESFLAQFEATAGD